MTYIQVGKGFVYLSLIMDTFSRKIVGWALQPTQEAKGPVGALKMALQTRKKKTELIHIAPATRSDRGVQYYSWAYVDLIQKAGIKMSMCSSAEPNENSMAERTQPNPKRRIQFGQWICVGRGSFKSNSTGD